VSVSLGRKTLLWLAVVLLGLAAAEFTITAWVLDRNFAELEVAMLRKDLARVRGALDQELASLEHKSADWAMWDDTWNFMVDRNEAFVRSNLGLKSIANFGVNVMLLFDGDGRLVVARCVDIETASERPLPEALRRLREHQPMLLRHDTPESKHAGVLCIGTEQAVLVCTRPIHTSAGDGPGRGTLLVAYLFDDHFRDRMRKLTELPVEFSVTASAKQPDTFDTTSTDRIVARGAVADFSHERALTISIAQPRQILARGRDAQALIAAGLIGLCAAGLAAAAWLVHVLVIRRLRRLRATMVRITATGELPKRLEFDGADELGDLGRAFDAMTGRLRHTMLDLQRATQAKSAFLANVSHEVRTPLSAILGYADLMLDPAQTERERLESAETIRRNGQHLLTIINQILDVAKIEAGQMQVESIPCDVPTVLRDVVELMRGAAHKRGLSVEVRVLTPMPRTIHTDPTRLKQILLNLIGNAIKFTERGGVSVSVRYHVTHKLTIAVADTGIGIPADKLGELFQPFAQADQSHSRRFGGTGLGLALARDLARLLGGDITVASVAGQGSTFTLEVGTGEVAGPFVVTLDDDASAQPSDPGAAPNGGKTELVGVQLLLAEDAPDSQRLIATILRGRGARVALASDGRHATRLIREALAAGNAFDLVLMDMQMPELDGYGATAAIRELGYAGPIIALTANAMAGDRDRCLAAGCNDYATKPLDARALLALVRRHALAKLGAPR
jgi:signal transduction histidine kinase/CheY-like chemotaxis protein